MKDGFPAVAALIPPQLHRETKRGRKMSSRSSGDKREVTFGLVPLSLTSHGSTIPSFYLLVCGETWPAVCQRTRFRVERPGALWIRPSCFCGNPGYCRPPIGWGQTPPAFLFPPTTPVLPAAREKTSSQISPIVLTNPRWQEYEHVGEVPLWIVQFHRSITIPQRQERENIQVPSFVDSGESLSEHFCSRRQHSVMFIFQRSQERTEARRRRHRLIWRSHLSLVFTRERVTSVTFKGNKNDLSDLKLNNNYALCGWTGRGKLNKHPEVPSDVQHALIVRAAHRFLHNIQDLLDPSVWTVLLQHTSSHVMSYMMKLSQHRRRRSALLWFFPLTHTNTV